MEDLEIYEHDAKIKIRFSYKGVEYKLKDDNGYIQVYYNHCNLEWRNITHSNIGQKLMLWYKEK